MIIFIRYHILKDIDINHFIQILINLSSIDFRNLFSQLSNKRLILQLKKSNETIVLITHNMNVIINQKNRAHSQIVK